MTCSQDPWAHPDKYEALSMQALREAQSRRQTLKPAVAALKPAVAAKRVSSTEFRRKLNDRAVLRDHTIRPQIPFAQAKKDTMHPLPQASGKGRKRAADFFDEPFQQPHLQTFELSQVTE